MNASEPETWRGWMVRPLRRYADFRGRSSRREFWWYCLFLVLGYGAITALAFPLAMTATTSDTIGIWLAGGWGIFFLANLVPGLALTTRRLHDMGVSGALLIVIFVVLAMLSVVGWLGYMTWMSMPGQAKPNRWGDPPGAKDVAEVFA